LAVGRKNTGRMDGKPLLIRLSPAERTEWDAAVMRAGAVEAEVVRALMAGWVRSKPAAAPGGGPAAIGELRIEREVDPLTGRPA
jgi:hypothetical protein